MTDRKERTQQILQKFQNEYFLIIQHNRQNKEDIHMKSLKKLLNLFSNLRFEDEVQALQFPKLVQVE
jgi:hypothetical protein